MRSLIAAIRFLTRLRAPGPPTRAEDLPGSVGWFPLVGGAANAAVAGLAVAATLWWPPTIAAVVAIAAGLLLTGGFHEDAAADAADGLGGGADNDKILAIMRDSRIGAYAGMALWVVLTLRWAVLVHLLSLPGLSAVAIWAAAGAWGRWTAAPLLAALPPLSAGLAKDIGSAASWPTIALATLLALAVAAFAGWLIGPPVWIAAGVAVALPGFWGIYLWRRLGGQSGDLLGAGNLIVELGFALALIAAQRALAA